MPKAKSHKKCSSPGCLTEYYAKDFCKQHYMATNRDKFNPNKNPDKPKKPEFDVNDFWHFVQKELKLG